MGAEPWQYTVPYQADVAAALDELRQAVFAAGEFRAAFWEDIGRGEAVCVTTYEGGRPSELFFAGYSFD